MRTLNAAGPWAAVVTLALAACASPARAPGDPAPAETVVEVNNQTPDDLNIFAVSQVGGRQRLGTAAGLRTSYFDVPARLVLGVTNLRFQASSVGSLEERFSEQITVVPGDTVVITIPRR